MENSPVSCPLAIPDETLSAWRDDLLLEDELDTISHHVMTCDACQAQLALFAEVADLLRGQRELEPDERILAGVERRARHSVHLRPVMRQAPAEDTRRAGTRRVVGLRHALATIAAVLVVALLAGTLTFMHSRGSLRTVGGVTSESTSTATAIPTAVPTQVVVPPTCGSNGLPVSPRPAAGTPVDHSVAVDRYASRHGITITIDRAYADATQTVITYHMQTNINPPTPISPVLIDARGHRYAVIYNGWDINRGGHVVFTPLPPKELGTPQTLTFFVQQMLPDPTGSSANVDGPWQIPFTLTPAAGTSVALNNTPVTHNGLSIQPLRLDVAPAGGELDGANGGARVVVRFSGLAPSARLYDQHDFDVVFDLGQGSVSSGCGHGIVELVLPNGQQIPPGAIHPLGQNAPATFAEQQAALAQTVGPSGTVDLEVLFYTPIPSGTSITLYLDQVPAQIAGTTKPKHISGPWEFRLQPTA